MKKLLIISPYFPPVNAADMQRVRMSLPYFANYDWDAEVVMVDADYADMAKDELLLQSIPAKIKIHKIKALDKKWTSRFGLGSIALRSLWFYKQEVNKLLKKHRYDLIYFSTTQFPVCILGAYWKKRFGIPYVMDIQDPWHSDYYQNKPKSKRPKKYWLSYRLNKYLEPVAIKNVNGLISVSEGYITGLKKRYPAIKDIPYEIIPFGSFDRDMEIAMTGQHKFSQMLAPGFINIVYVGRGGADMHKSVAVLFEALVQGLKDDPALYNQIKIYFIGTSYAPNGTGQETISPLANQFGLENNVIEVPGRISYFHTLITLKQADGLFMPGSDDPDYTASKIYPYLSTQKPLLAILHPQSPAIDVLKEYGAKYIYDYQHIKQEDIFHFIRNLNRNRPAIQQYRDTAIEKYSAAHMTSRQCHFFDKVLYKKP